ncbi:hypothetical protein D915_005447 [Fasciola hepatica]|uniref:Uncharacterized protein n=1 Tax=Fasciola hepatica TaxID=6192 RepID=A0A4E0RYG1_FASHE|nr:hypothetical protein D915_005447 [Fasciola hepatica]
MFIIRLAAEALSLSERNESDSIKANSNGHKSEQATSNRNLAVVRADSLDTFHSNRADAAGNASGKDSVGYEVPNRELTLSTNKYAGLASKVEVTHSSNYASDLEKNSILYDLLSGRENLHTACHRSRLFLLTTKRSTNDPSDVAYSNGMRRRKPLRPVKNVNTPSEYRLVNDVIEKVAPSIARSKPGSSVLPSLQRSSQWSTNQKTRLQKLKDRKVDPDPHHSHLSKTSNGDHFLQNKELISIVHKKKSKLKAHHFLPSWRKNGNENSAEQPLDLSTAKSNNVSSNLPINETYESVESYSTEKFRKKARGYRRHCPNLSGCHDFVSDCNSKNGENTNPVESHTVHSSTVLSTSAPVTFGSGTLLNTDGLISIIPNLLNAVFSPSNNLEVPITNHSGSLLTPRLNSKVGFSTKAHKVEQAEVFSLGKPQACTQPIYSKPVVGPECVRRFLDFYGHLTCRPRSRDSNLVRKCDPTSQMHSFSHSTAKGTHYLGTSPVQDRPDNAANSLQTFHTHMSNSHQLSLPEQSTPTIPRAMHPLVDRILTTLHAMNPTIKNASLSEPNFPSLNFTITGNSGAGPSSKSALIASSSKITDERCASPNKELVKEDVFFTECLTKLRTNPILNYLVQFIKHPEALLIDCFNQTHLGQLDHELSFCDNEDAIVHRLGLITFQLLARTETGRIELFQDSWHLLYLLCAMERGRDTWATDYIGLRHATPDESHRSWIMKLDVFSKLRRLNAQLNLSTQMFNLLRGFLLNHGKGGQLDSDTIEQLCESLPGQNHWEISGSKNVILKKFLRKLCLFSKDFVSGLFISPNPSSQAVECYLTNWLRLG